MSEEELLQLIAQAKDQKEIHHLIMIVTSEYSEPEDAIPFLILLLSRSIALKSGSPDTIN